MENEFSEVMSKRTDEELIKIVTIDKEGYQPLAVVAAEEEIKKRGIDSQKIEEQKVILTSKDEQQKTIDSKTVGSLTRLVHFIVDTIAFLVLSIIFGFIIGLFFQITSSIFAYLLFIISFFVYYIIMEHKLQKTLGKYITKTKVVTKEGQKAELGDIIKRTLFRLIPFDNISYLFTRNGFHDYLSDTTLVKD
jgi:hypothetical protein